MLIGMGKTNRIHILAKMESSSFDFHLTGSRAFGNFRSESDYDFFAENNSTLQTFLVNIGFNLLSASKYNDRHTIRVYHHPTEIDVQIVKSVSQKLEAQIKLKNFPGFNAIDKKQKTALWNLVLP